MQTRSTDWKESTAHRIQEKEKQPGLSTDRRTGKRLSEQKGHHWGVAVPHSMWSSARGGLTQGGPRPSEKGNNSQGSLNTVTEEAEKGLIGNENGATDRAAASPPSESLWSRPPTLRTGPSGGGGLCGVAIHYGRQVFRGPALPILHSLSRVMFKGRIKAIPAHSTPTSPARLQSCCS